MGSSSIFRGIDFSGTEWNERNVDIAARLGVEPELVSKARKHFGMVVDRRIDWSVVDFSRPVKDIAAELGCSLPAVNAAKKAMGLTRERIPWHEADWSMTDSEIADIYACTVASVQMARKRITGKTMRQARAEGLVESRDESKRESAKNYSAERSKRTISVLFPQEDFDALASASERTGRTKTDIIREATSAWIRMHE